MSKPKKENDLCPHCQKPVFLSVPKTKTIEKTSYYYAYYLKCSGCGNIFQIKKAKRPITPDIYGKTIENIVDENELNLFR